MGVRPKSGVPRPLRARPAAYGRAARCTRSWTSWVPAPAFAGAYADFAGGRVAPFWADFAGWTSKVRAAPRPDAERLRFRLYGDVSRVVTPCVYAASGRIRRPSRGARRARHAAIVAAEGRLRRGQHPEPTPIPGEPGMRRARRARRPGAYLPGTTAGAQWRVSAPRKSRVATAIRSVYVR